MKTIYELINCEIKKQFNKYNIDEEFAFVSISNRPDLCDLQINSSFNLAKIKNIKPIDIAKKLAEYVKNIEVFNTKVFSYCEAIMPGFVNLTLSDEFLNAFLLNIYNDENLSVELVDNKKCILLDYGGANVAKPLHVGHLRSAVIGECVKRICKKVGNDTISDIHLGDIGLQMGLVIAKVLEDKKENDIDIEYLSTAYPLASKKAKEVDENNELKNKEFNDLAHEITKDLQLKKEPYYSLWKKIVDVSIKDLTRIYNQLYVHFDLWNGEATVIDLIPYMLENFKNNNVTHISNNALVIDVKEDDDKIEIPPCIIQKSDGAFLYATTDLATLVDREKNFNIDEYIYITDKRQELHFTQVFRAAKISKIVNKDKKLIHIGFGTMNGVDNKALKTRDGDIYRLEVLINDTKNAVKEILINNNKSKTDDDKELDDTAMKIAIATLKYGDLSNQCSKDYIFDLNKFLDFNGNTGPYILYTIVRIKSLLKKLNIDENEFNIEFNNKFDNIYNLLDDKTKKLLHNIKLNIIKYNKTIYESYNDLAPHYLCKYVFELSNSFNTFYNDVHIISECNELIKKYYIFILILLKRIMLDVINVLGFECPEFM